MALYGIGYGSKLDLKSSKLCVLWRIISFSIVCSHLVILLCPRNLKTPSLSIWEDRVIDCIDALHLLLIQEIGCCHQFPSPCSCFLRCVCVHANSFQCIYSHEKSFTVLLIKKALLFYLLSILFSINEARREFTKYLLIQPIFHLIGNLSFSVLWLLFQYLWSLCFWLSSLIYRYFCVSYVVLSQKKKKNKRIQKFWEM